MGRHSRIFTGFVFICIGIGVVISAIRLHIGTPLEPEPGFFPFLGGIVLFFLSLIFVFQAWRKHGSGMTRASGHLRRPAIAVTGLVVYAALFNTLGYIITTSILSAIVLRILDTKSWWMIAAFSLFLSIGSYLLFDRVLGVELPKGILASIL